MKKTLLSILLAVTFFSAVKAESPFDFLYDNKEQETAPSSEDQRMITVVDATHEYDLNPHTACYSTEAQVLCGLYEGLFSYNPSTLEPVPAIAKSYKVSRNKLKWTFYLNENYTFSNGDKITAQTIRDSWIKLLATPDAPFASLVDCISGAEDFRLGKCSADDVKIEAREDLVLVVELNKPAEHLARILCHHAFAAVSEKENVYSGAFVLQSYKDGKLVMLKNEKYHDAQYVLIPGITFIQSDDLKENTHLFNTGDADWVTGGIDTAGVLNQNAVHISAEFGTQYLFFKDKNEPWNDSAVRMALLEAIPWSELRKNYFVPATTFVYPLNGYPSVTGLSDYDKEDAVEMMNEARNKLGIPLDKKLSLVFAITDVEYLKNQYELLKAAWAPLGVELTVQTTPAERYNTSIASWNADLFSYTWIGDFADPLAFLELFRGGSSLNVSSYNNEKYNKLLDDAANANDYVSHNKLLSQAEQCLLDDGVVIPISHPVSLHVIDLDCIGGWTTNALDIHPLRYLYVKHSEATVPNLVYLSK